ncbi:patatin-like phospholipase family protein [Ferruginibacter sp.]
MRWFIRGCIEVLTIILQVLSNNFLNVISLLLIYFIIGVSDQGQDMMINLNLRFGGPLSLYFLLGIMSLVHWQFPKFFSDRALKLPRWTDLFKGEFSSPVHGPVYERIVPRLFGVLTWFLPAYGIIKAMNKYNVYVEGANDWYRYNPNATAYLLCTTGLVGIALWNDWFLRFYQWLLKSPKGNWAYAIICGFLALLPFIFWPFNYGLPSSQFFIWLGFTSYGLLFAMLTSTRWLIVEQSHVKLICWLFSDKTINRLVWILAGIAALVFIVMMICNGFNIVFAASYRYTLSIVFCGVTFYVVILTLVRYMSKRHQRNYMAVALLVMLALVHWNPEYFHRVQKITPAQNAQPAPTLRTYMAGWLRSRQAALQGDTAKAYPIILINSYGGGIRAAAWTCLLVNRLDSLTGGAFQQHVFCYSGASGGTIGSSVLCANGFNEQFKAITSYREKDLKYHDFFSDYDYLTADLVGLLGNDVLYSVIPGNRFRDRAVLQTTCWEKAYENCFGSPVYGQDFFATWSDPANSYKTPLLFSNSSETTHGNKGIIAPVELSSVDFMGDELVKRLMEPGTSMKLSTAAFMSARFPYVSPAGEVGVSGRYFVDGGVKENSGAETNFAVKTLLDRVIQDSLGGNKGQFPIICISIKNTPVTNKIVEERKTVNQLTAPVNMVINAGLAGATAKADSINRFAFGSKYFLFYPQATKFSETGTNIFGVDRTEPVNPVLPLGWQISGLALHYMEKAIDDNNQLKPGENNIPAFLRAFNDLSHR